jgi:hypothetical protein
MERRDHIRPEHVLAVWQQVATSLVAVVVAMLGFWLVEGREYVTRAEASEMIAKESPYIRDRNMVLDRLSEMVEINRQLARAIQDLRVEISELRIERCNHPVTEGR